MHFQNSKDIHVELLAQARGGSLEAPCEAAQWRHAAGPRPER